MKFTFEESNGGHSDTLWALASLVNGLLASGSDDNTIKIWEVTNGKLKYTFDQTNGGHSNLVNLLESLENGYLASASADGEIKIWDITI